MIYTRFDSPVKIVGVMADKYETWIKIEYSDCHTKEVHIDDLRADGGICEIEQAIDNLGKKV